MNGPWGLKWAFKTTGSLSLICTIQKVSTDESVVKHDFHNGSLKDLEVCLDLSKMKRIVLIIIETSDNGLFRTKQRFYLHLI